MNTKPNAQVVVIGGGFSGLAAAYELALAGVAVLVLEAEAQLGGLAASFDLGPTRLERFYHHWFTSDLDVAALTRKLGLTDRLETHRSRTGIYCDGGFFKLSSPWDVLNFTPLAWRDRLRLGLLPLKARRIKDWTVLEGRSAQAWLQELGGETVYRVVWEPLLRGKFGPFAEQISAVWFWNKLKLRGGSRGPGGGERLAYLKGGCALLVDALAERIRALGGRIETNTSVQALQPISKAWQVTTSSGALTCDHVVATTPPPLLANMLRTTANQAYLEQLERIQYLANICLILELDRPLSQTYWLNVSDPSFPFVAVIEHTNFEPAQSYGGRHLVYLSKYLLPSDAAYALSAPELLQAWLPYLQRIFPDLQRDWILGQHLWRARWAQPIVETHYQSLIPPEDAPLPGLHLCAMAQVYPEDRGTNYAIRAGRTLGRRLSLSIRNDLS